MKVALILNTSKTKNSGSLFSQLHSTEVNIIINIIANNEPETTP